MSVADISAPRLTLLGWSNAYDPRSIQLGIEKMTRLGIEFFVPGGVEDASQNNHNCMTLLRLFDRIHTLDLLISYRREICIEPYLMEHMPRLPNITFLALGVMAYGHSFGASSFDVLRRCTGVKKLDLDFLSESKLELSEKSNKGISEYASLEIRKKCIF